jgi:hypothetical protein
MSRSTLILREKRRNLVPRRQEAARHRSNLRTMEAERHRSSPRFLILIRIS